MIKQLIKLANHLDNKGLRKEADILDRIISLAEDDQEMYDEWISVDEEGNPLESLDTGEYETEGMLGEGRGLSQYKMDSGAELSYSEEEAEVGSEDAMFERGELDIMSPEDIEMQLEENRGEALHMIDDLKNATVSNLSRVSNAITEGIILEDLSADFLWAAYVASENLKLKLFPDYDSDSNSSIALGEPQ
tara:strand:+ start:27361 stop:27933 length:573 start_codon:yes stop_codon:yes gene_type:complete